MAILTVDEIKTKLSQGRKAVQALNIAGNNPSAVSPAQLERMEKDISAAQHIIDMISEPADAAILQLYYLQGVTWHEAARQAGYTDTHTMRRARWAIQKLAEKTE